MRKTSLILAGILASFIGLASANAMTLGERALPDHTITLVYGQCGWGAHPTPWGRCVPNGYPGYGGYGGYRVYRPVPPVYLPFPAPFHPWHGGWHGGWHRR